MCRERCARRRQAVVAALGGENAFEHRVANARIEERAHRAQAPAKERRRAEGNGEDGGKREQLVDATNVVDDPRQRREVAIDARGFVREDRLEARGPEIEPLRLAEVLTADEEVVEAARLELVEFDVPRQAEAFEEAANAFARTELADVVHARAEPVAVEAEGLRPSAREIVLLQHDHLLTRAR